MFEVPIQILNTNDVAAGIQRYLSFSLQVGDRKLWSALHEVTILDKGTTASAGSVPAGTVTPRNEFPDSNNEVLAGNAAVFLVTLQAPAGWSNFDTKITANAAKGTNIKVTRFCKRQEVVGFIYKTVA